MSSKNDPTKKQTNGQLPIKLGIDDADANAAKANARKHHKRKKIIIIFVIIAAIILGGIGWYTLHQNNVADGNQQSSQNVAASVNSNDTESDNNESSSVIGTSTVTTNINTQQQTENAPSSNTNTNSNAYSDADNGGPRKSGISNVTMARQQQEDAYMKTVDTTAISNTASAFMKAFLTFDQSSLSSGTWRSSCIAYVDYVQMTNDANKDGMMYKRLYDDSWAQYAAKYQNYYGQVQSVTVNSVYATTADDGTITPIADVNVVCDVCDGEPGTSPWWDRVTRKNINYLVHFDTDGKVVSIGNVGATTMQEIRSSQWREDTTGAQ